MTSLQYYTYHEHTHDIIVHVQYTMSTCKLCATLCHVMARHACVCMHDGHVLTTTQTEYNYGMGQHYRANTRDSWSKFSIEVRLSRALA